MSQQHGHGSYYLPEPSRWPIIGSCGLFLLLVGFANWLHDNIIGHYMMGAGTILLIIVMIGWFGTVINESRAGVYNKQADRSFRWGMSWFIFSEVLFFSAFFGALFYARVLSVQWLGGHDGYEITHLLLWPNFHATWPVLINPNNAQFVGPQSIMETWGLPALNTIILLTSGGTITWAHWALLKNRRTQLAIAMLFTVVLGITFLSCQFHEYAIAYTEKHLTLASGIYGTTFFMLTGFHGLHVTIGTIMLIVILCRCLKGHFDVNNHFAFEAVSWYWHFVDVVWLGLFIFVYWL
jgi:cytochrome c oxidase subunit 3